MVHAREQVGGGHYPAAVTLIYKDGWNCQVCMLTYVLFMDPFSLENSTA